MNLNKRIGEKKQICHPKSSEPAERQLLTYLRCILLVAELCEIKTFMTKPPFFKIEKKCCPSDGSTCWRGVVFGYDVCCPEGECEIAAAGMLTRQGATAKRLTSFTAGCPADKWTGSACCIGDKKAGKVDP